METVRKKERESNLELFRIVTMLMIIAHHYVVNSGLLDGGGPVRTNIHTFRAVFAVLLGAWGKTGINCFVLITGYFMCRSNITLKKFLKLFLEYMFYKIVIAGIFLITGYNGFTFKMFLSELIPIPELASNFVPCYLVFFLCIPFLNLLIPHMNEAQHVLITLIGLFTYSFMGFFHSVEMNYVSWFIVVYFVASYVRLYPKPVFSKLGVWTFGLLVSILLSALSVIVSIKLKGRYGIQNYYWFVTDSNMPFALLTAFCAFLFFKNLPVPQSRVINAFGGSTFGVLLLHSVNKTVRHLLWDDVFNVAHAYTHPYFYLVSIGSILSIFLVCSLIDMLRIRLLERPLFARLDRRETGLWSKLKDRFDRLVKTIE